MKDPRKEDGMYQESIKNLRTNLLFIGMNIKTVLMTSCFPNEGKSDVTFQLSRELGNIDKRVLLLDCDIRKSEYIIRYDVGQSVKGLSHFLSGQAGEEEIVYHTNFKNMDIIFAGSLAPNPTELLEGEAVGELLKDLREKYDYIIIDTPPASTMSDALIVAKWCDGAILVVESGRVSYRVARRVKQLLQQTGCRILGAVLNKVDTHAGGYGHYGRYGYYGYGRYGYYGQGYYEKSEESDAGSGEAKKAVES